MSTHYGAFIKGLREERGFAQSIVAQRIGISRSSYIALEHDLRELTLQEAEELAKLFDVPVDSFTRAAAPQYEKYKQMILAFLRAGAATGDGKVPKTKLAKLLYLADFAWYYDTLESMSGMQYIRRAYGPVPDPYFRALAELEEEGKINISHKGDAMLVQLGAGAGRERLGHLQEEEKVLIRKILTKWKNKRTQEIVTFTHEQLPYKLCAPDEVIPYELITQEDPGYVY